MTLGFNVQILQPYLFNGGVLMKLRHIACYFLLVVLTAIPANRVLAQSDPDEGNQPPSTDMSEVVGLELLGVSGNNVGADLQFIPIGATGAHFFATGQINEDVRDPSLPGDGLWWDLDIKVTVSPNDIDSLTGQPREPVMLSIDKDVFNNTRFRWTDFHMTLGMRLADGSFVESDEFDFLFFKDNPPPLEETGAFPNPPMKDEPFAADNLWWLADPANGFPGVLPGGLAKFWLGIQVPPSKFDPGTGMATFVLREHASIPEPATLALLVSSGIALLIRQRRKV